MLANGAIRGMGICALWLLLGGPGAVHATETRQGTAAEEAAALLHEHCRRCHGLELVAERRHSGFGWYWTIERMRWIHGAAIPAAARDVVVAHLTERDAAGWRLMLYDAVRVLALPILVLAAAGAIAVRRLRRRKRKAGDARDQ